mmetsp:Transcript_7228/g.13359  ORF Transcript_7228/g.13359 Transcript_7228/m.13359 type:complete len:259 (+) Transcript_7228:1953-2729(+)
MWPSSRAYGYLNDTKELHWIDLKTKGRSMTTTHFAFPMNGSLVQLSDNTLFVFGGFVGGRASSETYSLDITKEYAAVTKASMITPRYYTSFSVYQGILYVSGGVGNATQLSECEMYSLAEDAWTALPSLPCVLANANAVIVGTLNRLYLVGGLTLDQNNIAIYMLNLDSLTWSTMSVSIDSKLWWKPCFLQHPADLHFYCIANDLIYKYDCLSDTLRVVKRLRHTIMGWSIIYHYHDGIVYTFPGVHPMSGIVVGGLT